MVARTHGNPHVQVPFGGCETVQYSAGISAQSLHRELNSDLSYSQSSSTGMNETCFLL